MALTLVDFTQGVPRAGNARFGAPTNASMAATLRSMADALDRGDIITQGVALNSVAENDDFTISTLTIRYAERFEAAE